VLNEIVLRIVSINTRWHKANKLLHSIRWSK